jgi:large-conductance mechanosensitive channel
MSFLDKKKTYTDMQFVNLTEPDLSIRDAKKNSMFTTNSMSEFNMSYFQWKSSYRNTYSPEFLIRYGYATSSEGNTKKLVDEEVVTYLEDNVPNYLSSQYNTLVKPDIIVQFLQYMDLNYPMVWFNSIGYLYQDNEKYGLADIDYKLDDEGEDDESNIVGTFICVTDEDKDDIQIETSNTLSETVCLVSKYNVMPPKEDTNPGEPENSDDKSITIVATKANVNNGEYAMFHVYQDGSTDSDEVTANFSLKHICTTDDNFDSNIEYYDVDTDEWKDITDDLRIPVDDDGDNLINSLDQDNDNTDTDDDGINDGADVDYDGDGVDDYTDDDKDDDGIRDEADADDDGEDGTDDGKEDQDEDGIVDKYDLDVDNDGTNEENTKYNGLQLRVLTKEYDDNDALLYFGINIDSSNVSITKDLATGSIYNNVDNIAYYIEPSENLPEELITIYDNSSLMTPVITLKENGVLVQETVDSKKMLNKLNVSASDFQESLSDTDDDGEPVIDNAYLINGLSPRNPYIVEAKTYDPKEAESLPIKLIDMLVKEQLVSGEDEDTSYTVTEEIADKFYTKYMREQAYLARALFKTFAYYAGNFSEEGTDRKGSPNYIGPYVDEMDAKQIVFESTTAINQEYTFDIKIEIKSGLVRPNENIKKQGIFYVTEHDIDTCPKDSEGNKIFPGCNSIENDDSLHIKVQRDEYTYYEMTITNYRCTFKISGHRFHLHLRTSEAEHRIIIPYFVLYQTKFTEFVTIYEHSLCLISYAIKTIVVKWYIRFAGVLISLAITLITGGLGAGIGHILVDVVINVAITLIAEQLQGTSLGAIFNVLMAIVQLSGGSLDTLVESLSENFLQIAVQVGQIAQGFAEMKKQQEEAEKQALRDAEDSIEDRLENSQSSIVGMPVSQQANYSYAESVSPDTFYNNALGVGLYNYDQYYAITESINRRISVVSG